MESFIELLKRRRTCRDFTDEVVDKESVEYILEAVVKKILNFPNNYSVLSIAAIGHKNNQI